MSSYPRPTESNIFNPIDYEGQSDEEERDVDEYHDDSDHVNFLLKSGGHMTGSLSVPQISFSDHTSQTSAFSTEKQTELETATTQIDVLGNSIVAVNSKVNNITSTDITLKNVLADSFTSPGVSNLAQIESIGVNTSNLSVTNTASFDKNVVCAEMYSRNYSNGEQSRFATVNNWLYVQNNERIVFDELSDGSDPNVEINTQTGELKCESLIVQNNLNNNGMFSIKSNKGSYIEGYSTSLNARQYWIGTSGSENTRLALNIVNLDENINLYAQNGFVDCQSDLQTKSLIINNETQNNAYTDADHDLVVQIPSLSQRLTTVEGHQNSDSNEFTEYYQNRINNNHTNIDNTVVELNKLIAKNFTPIGSVIAFAGPTIPAGFLLCDGEMVFKSSFPELYAVIGHHYQNEPPNTYNFNLFQLPDLRQCYPTGVGTNSTANMKYSQPEKILGQFSDMSVQDHEHIVLLADNDGSNASFVSPGSSTTYAEHKTKGTYHPNGEVMATNITQGCNVSMNYIIKYT